MSFQVPGITLPEYNLANSGGIVGTIFTPLQNVLQQIGLGTPGRRLMGVGLGTAGLLYLLKPHTFFDHDGHPRPWSVTCHDSRLDPVPVPWWMAAILAGTAAAVFI